MIDIIVWIACRLIVPILLIGGFYVAQVFSARARRARKGRLELIDPKHEHKNLDLALAHSAWAEDNGFVWIGAYAYTAPFMGRTVLCAWRRKEVLMVCYAYAGRAEIDFATSYEGDASLTTAGTAAAVLYPIDPRDRKQGFPGASPDELLRRHVEGDAYLRERYGMRLPVHQQTFEQEFISGMARTATRILRMWFFPLRSFWWYVTLKKRANIPVRDQRVDTAFDPTRFVS